MNQDEFESMATFRERMCEAVEEAVHRRVRQLTLVDPDFAAWPLDEARWLDALSRLVHLPEQRVVMIASQFEGVQGTRPRFVAWRRTHAHAVQPLAPDDGVVGIRNPGPLRHIRPRYPQNMVFHTLPRNLVQVHSRFYGFLPGSCR